MKRLTIILSVLALGASAVSCSKSGLEVPQGPGEPNATPVTLSLTTAPPEMSARQASRTPASSVSSTEMGLVVNCGMVDTKSTPPLTTPEEQAVRDLWVIQFDKASGNRVGAPYYVPQDQITQSGTTVSLPAQLTSAATDQIVYFIANTNSPSVFHPGNCDNIAQLEQVSRTLIAEYKPVAGGGLPMLGFKEFPRIESGTLLTGITLRRLVAKVTLKYKVASSFVGFTLRRVQLRNAAGTITYAVEKTPGPGVNFPAKFPVATGAESHIDYPVEDLTTAGTDGDYQTYTWYLPENLRQATTTVSNEWDRYLGNTDGMATYIEMEGSLAGSTRAEKLTYRIPLGNFAADPNDYNIRRNTIYTFEVTLLGKNIADKRITVGSFDQNNAAMITPNSGNTGAVTFDIRKCINNGFTAAAALKSMLGTGSTLTADVLWQDGNVVNTADVSLDKVNGLLTVRSSKVTPGNAIVALYPNANKKQGEILWSWHVWVTDYQPKGQTAVAPNTAYNVTGGQVHVYGAEYLKVNAGKVIMDRNLGATKTYSAPPTALDVTADEAFGMFYQWGRKDPLPSWDGVGSTDATAKTIKIYAANGTTELAEGAKDNTTATGYKKVSVATAGSTPPATLTYATKNPLSFIYATAAPYDWYTTAADNSAGNGLWGGGGAQKSAYDPCPAGWRIAPNGTWSDFGTNPYAAPFFYYINGVKQTASGTPAFVQSGRNGRFYEAGAMKAWYPAPGFRHPSTGVLAGVGYQGFSWSSTVSGTSAGYLDFNSTSLNPSNAHNRGHGFPVRCLQE